MSKDLEAYRSYTEEDYLENVDFRNWVLNPTSYVGPDWDSFFRSNMEQAERGSRARVLLLEMKTYFQPTRFESETFDEAFIQRLSHQVAIPKAGKLLKHSLLLKQIAVAASLVFCISIAAWFQQKGTQQEMQIFSTNYGEWETHHLPDGSEVQLNANSEIKFVENWQKGEDRRVWLKGEAFFEVNKDAKGAKFTVVTEDLEINVLGTAFNVHSRGEETGVFLLEGKVHLDLGEEEKVILPGEFIAYSAPQKQITQYQKTDAEFHVSWKEGSLVLRNVSVQTILEKIEELYGLPIEVKDEELLGKEKTIAIPMDKIELAILILSKTLGTEVELKEGRLLVGA